MTTLLSVNVKPTDRYCLLTIASLLQSMLAPKSTVFQKCKGLHCCWNVASGSDEMIKYKLGGSSCKAYEVQRHEFIRAAII